MTKHIEISRRERQQLKEDFLRLIHNIQTRLTPSEFHEFMEEVLEPFGITPTVIRNDLHAIDRGTYIEILTQAQARQIIPDPVDDAAWEWYASQRSTSVSLE